MLNKRGELMMFTAQDLILYCVLYKSSFASAMCAMSAIQFVSLVLVSQAIRQEGVGRNPFQIFIELKVKSTFIIIIVSETESLFHYKQIIKDNLYYY